MSLKKAALLVGIDDYTNAPLRGCVDDAKAMEKLLARNEDDSPNFTCVSLHALIGGAGPQITRARLREEVKQILARKIDMALIYFSGHGSVTNRGGFLVTQDWTKGDEGVGMHEIVEMANDPNAVPQVTIIVDACFSGKLGSAPAIKDDRAVLREGVAILAASSPDEAALLRGGRSVFTQFVCGALEGGAADVRGEITSASVYTYAEQIMGPLDQRPMYKANVARLDALRTCVPMVPATVLRKLPTYFPAPDHILLLDPAYEPDHNQHPPGTTPDPVKEAAFSELQKLRDARLLIPHGATHLFFAAIQSAACRLTPLGQFYWRLAKEGRLLIAGITGHQNLGEASAWVRQVLGEEAAARGVTRGLTSLALGADQLFAEVLLEVGIPYETVIPCAAYEETFADASARDQFQRLLATSSRVEQLPFDRPSEQSFLAAGERIVIRCELLLAVWNGEPARGLGGTGDIVAFARSRSRSWIHIDPVARAVRSGT